MSFIGLCLIFSYPRCFVSHKKKKNFKKFLLVCLRLDNEQAKWWKVSSFEMVKVELKGKGSRMKVYGETKK